MNVRIYDMIDTKKEQERDELHRAIWAIADDMRGSVDGWDFKSYVLGTMFYRFISENLTAYINKDEHAAGNTDFDYALMSDEDAEQAREGLVHSTVAPLQAFTAFVASAVVYPSTQSASIASPVTEEGT